MQLAAHSADEISDWLRAFAAARQWFADGAGPPAQEESSTWDVVRRRAIGGRRESSRPRQSRTSRAAAQAEAPPPPIKRTLTHTRVAVGRGSLSCGNASVARTESGNFILRSLSGLSSGLGSKLAARSKRGSTGSLGTVGEGHL